MTDKDFNKRLDFTNEGSALIPDNQNAQDLIDQLGLGQVVSFNEVTDRDLKFHRCYMALMGYVWSYLPPNFKSKVPKQHFYQWVKHLQRNYDVIYSFKNPGRKAEITELLKSLKKELRLTYRAIDIVADFCSKTELVEYKSIAFGRMSEIQFHEYVKSQLPFLYDQVIRPMFPDDEIYNTIIENIETDFRNFMSRL